MYLFSGEYFYTSEVNGFCYEYLIFVIKLVTYNIFSTTADEIKN